MILVSSHCKVGLLAAHRAHTGSTQIVSNAGGPPQTLAGAASRSFTSTAVNVVTSNSRTMVRVERRPKAKAYLRLHTSLVRRPPLSCSARPCLPAF